MILFSFWYIYMVSQQDFHQSKFQIIRTWILNNRISELFSSHWIILEAVLKKEPNTHIFVDIIKCIFFNQSRYLFLQQNRNQISCFNDDADFMFIRNANMTHRGRTHIFVNRNAKQTNLKSDYEAKWFIHENRANTRNMGLKSSLLMRARNNFFFKYLSFTRLWTMCNGVFFHINFNGMNMNTWTQKYI